jgi:hypothetical protein
MYNAVQVVDAMDQFCRQWLPDYSFSSSNTSYLKAKYSDGKDYSNYEYGFFINFNKPVIGVDKQYLHLSFSVSHIEADFRNFKEFWQRFIDTIEPLIYLSPLSPKYVEYKIMGAVHEAVSTIELFESIRDVQRQRERLYGTEPCPICHYPSNGKGHRCILTNEQL